MKYIAQIEKVIQIGPDDFKLTRPALEINDSTTVGEIKAWMAKVYNTKNPELDVVLIQVAELDKNQ